MYQSRNGASIARQGLAGSCSVYLVFLTLVFLLLGSVFLGMSAMNGIGNNPHFQSSFFKSARDDEASRKLAFRIVGPIMLTLSFVTGIVAISMCCYVYRKMKSDKSSGTVVQQGPYVSGSIPPPAGYHMTATAGAYPMGPQPANPAPQTTYPVYPGQQPPTYPPPQGAGYPPPSGAAYPPPAGGYPPPSAVDPSAPLPPSYSEVSPNNEKSGYP